MADDGETSLLDEKRRAEKEETINEIRCAYSCCIEINAKRRGRVQSCTNHCAEEEEKEKRRQEAEKKEKDKEVLATVFIG